MNHSALNMALIKTALLNICLFTCLYGQENFEIRGIDVSKWNQEIAWAQVALEGYDFVFIRATQGKKIIDSEFKTNWQNAHSEGMPSGAYHFYVTKRKGKAQARKFMKVVGSYESGDLPPVLDIERMDGGTPEQMRKQMKKWLALVEKKWGVKPILYSGELFYEKHLKGHFDEYKLWIARYRKALPNTEGWTFWQYSQKGRVAGIATETDLNYFCCDLETFCRMIETLND
ncbi:MAG: hypothetical protein MRY83_01585 [Flavobacteriales bacterium]|nr:hypothetical protein [Flavobacteriales bacterium]